MLCRGSRDSCWEGLKANAAQENVQCAVFPRIQPMRLTRIAKAFDDPDYIFEKVGTICSRE